MDSSSPNVVSMPNTGYVAPNTVSIPGVTVTDTTTMGFMWALLPKMLLLIPLVIVVVVVVVVVVVRIIVLPILLFLFPKFKKNFCELTLTCEKPEKPETPEIPYPPIDEYGYNQEHYGKNEVRKRREASGFPIVTLEQVTGLSNVVLAALQTQECQDKLLCELGKLSRSTPLHGLLTVFGSSIPRSFLNSTDCETFKCKKK